jgi:hypothetical protein
MMIAATAPMIESLTSIQAATGPLGSPCCDHAAAAPPKQRRNIDSIGPRSMFSTPVSAINIVSPGTVYGASSVTPQTPPAASKQRPAMLAAPVNGSLAATQIRYLSVSS